jgi:DeoR family fructose operon transcriptional repressor
MYAEERQRYVAEIVQRDGRADVAKLAEELQVTGETLRRDLITLERRGLVRRTHGGVISVQRLGFEPANPVRAVVMIDEKRRIAQAALNEVPDEGAILIDSGTTTAFLAEILPTNRHLNVVTNSVDVLTLLVPQTNFTVMMLGGRMRPTTNSSVDEWALRALADIRVDVAFMGANGVTVEHGLTTSDQADASTKAAMMRCARRVVLLADHSKIGNEYFHLFGQLADVDVVITDSGINADLEEDLRAAGATVVTA